MNSRANLRNDAPRICAAKGVRMRASRLARSALDLLRGGDGAVSCHVYFARYPHGQHASSAEQREKKEIGVAGIAHAPSPIVPSMRVCVHACMQRATRGIVLAPSPIVPSMRVWVHACMQRATYDMRAGASRRTCIHKYDT